MGGIRRRAGFGVLCAAAACAVALMTSLAAPSVASASTGPVQMNSACALNTTGLLRYVASTSQCTSKEHPVTIVPGPAFTCVYPDGSVRWQKYRTDCDQPPKGQKALTLPPTRALVHFCAARATGVLTYITRPIRCPRAEFLVVVPVPDPVLANIESGALQYYAGTLPVPVTSAVTVSSPDTTTLAGATVSITSGLMSSEDSLGFTNQNGITGSYDAATGVLTLTGTASVADYQAALRSVTYADGHGLTATATRTISFQVNNGLTAGNLSNVVSRQINVRTNAAPVAGSVSAATDKNTAIDINVLAAATDSDGDTVSVVSVNTTGTKGSVSSNTNGTIHYDPNGQFQSLLAGQTATDTFTYTVSDGFQTSNPGTVTVTISGANDTPVLANIESTALHYAAGSAPVLVTATLTVSSPDTTTLAGATVSITSGLVASEDSLEFTNQNGITGSYDASTGMLTLTGTASLADYQTALRSVSYSDGNGLTATAGSRTVSFQVDDGLASSNLSNVESRTITVIANSPPVAGNVSAVTDKNTPIDINVLASASDPDGDTVTVASVDTIGTLGVVSINPDGTIHYDPNGQFQNLQRGQTATDTFGYTVSDGIFTASATVTVTINGIDDLPVISNVETAPLSYTAQSSAVVVTNTLTLSDADDATMSSAVVAITSGFDSSADTLAFVNQNGITGSFDAADGMLTLSGAASVADYQEALRSVLFATSDGSANPAARTVTFLVTDSLGAVSLPAQRTIDVLAAPQPPVAQSQSYLDVGNTPLAVGTSPAGPAATISASQGLLNGATDATFPVSTLSVTAVDTAGTLGSVAANPDGTFTYIPPAGFTGTESFTYTVASSGDPGATATAIVTITVGPVVWYVDNSQAAPGDGEAGSPFNTLAAATGVAGPGSIIFLYQGDATYTGGVTMQVNEGLFGQPYGLTVDGYSLVPAGGSNPTITNSTGDGIDLAEGADVEAVNVAGPSGNGVAASNVDNAIVGGTSALTISGAGGDGVDVSGGNGDLNFADASVTGSTGHSVLVAGRSGGTVSVGGAISDDGTGIALAGNTGATIAFTGTLTVSTGTNTGFSATGGGTVTATGAGSTVTTTTATAVSVSSTDIGSGGLTFQSISANGASTGIDLSSTGSSGGLTVTGTGAAGSGGTIMASTAAGISLASTTGPSFTDMVIEGAAADGINGSLVSGFTLAESTVSDNGRQVTVSGENDDGLDFSPNGTGSPNGLTGTVAITNSTITGSADNNAIISDSSGTLNLTVSGSTFSDNNPTTGNDGLHIDANGSTSATVDVSASTFRNNFGDAFQFETDSAATGTNSVGFISNTLDTTIAGVLGGGVVISPSGSSTTSVQISYNEIQDAVSNGIGIDTDGKATLSGALIGNTVGTPTVANSGSSQGNDVGVYAEGTATETLEITGNKLYQYQNVAGVYALDREGSPAMNLTITGNTIANPGLSAIWGLEIQAGATSGPPADAGKVCAAVSGNSMTGSAPTLGGGSDFELDQQIDTTIELPGYTGSANNDPAVVTFVQDQNIPGGGSAPSGAATDNVGSGGAGFVDSVGCPTPS